MSSVGEIVAYFTCYHVPLILIRASEESPIVDVESVIENKSTCLVERIVLPASLHKNGLVWGWLLQESVKELLIALGSIITKPSFPQN